MGKTAQTSTSRPGARGGKHADLLRTPTAWIVRLKYRALAYTLAIVLASVATISLVGVPWIPVAGVAVAAMAVSVGKLTHRLRTPTCLACGTDLSEQPVGAHGIACPSCGSVNTPGLVDLAKMDRRRRG